MNPQMPLARKTAGKCHSTDRAFIFPLREVRFPSWKWSSKARLLSRDAHFVTTRNVPSTKEKDWEPCLGLKNIIIRFSPFLKPKMYLGILHGHHNTQNSSGSQLRIVTPLSAHEIWRSTNLVSVMGVHQTTDKSWWMGWRPGYKVNLCRVDNNSNCYLCTGRC